MKITDLLLLGAGLLPYLFFGAQSITKQYDNIKNKQWNSVVKWLIIMIFTMIFVFITIKANFKELESINQSNNYIIFLFAFGLGLFVSGGYDSIKLIAESKNFKGETYQAKEVNIEDFDSDGNFIGENEQLRAEVSD